MSNNISKRSDNRLGANLLDELTPYRLRILVAVVEEGGFRRAAEALGLSQPAVSSHMRRLHKLVGSPIFVREGRQATLTEAGRTLYQYAQDILGRTDALKSDLEVLAAGEDHVALIAPPTYGTYVLPTLLAQFQQQHGSVRLSLSVATIQEVIDRVRTGRADIGIVIGGRVPDQLAEELLMGPLCRDELIIVESVDAPFSRGAELTLQELASVPFVRNALETGPGTRLTRLPTTQGSKLVEPVMELGSWEGTKAAVRQGMGVAMVLRSVVAKELAQRELQAVRVEGFPRRARVDLIGSRHRRGEHKSEVLGELVAYLRTEVPRVVSGANRDESPGLAKGI